jgi:hypothetical protein
MPRSTLSFFLATPIVAAPWALGQPASTKQTPVKEATEMADLPYFGCGSQWMATSARSFSLTAAMMRRRGTRMNAHQGCYEIRGNKIDYWDDTRFTSDGEFIDGVLHHGGMLFYRGGPVK